MSEHIALFNAEDDDQFIRTVTSHVNDGAPDLHGMTPIEYVARCRQCWQGCGTDQVYSAKLLIDKVLLDRKKDKDWPPPGFEQVAEEWEPSEDIYCVSFAVIDVNGEYMDAPVGYDGPKELPGYHGVLVGTKEPKALQDPEDPVPTNYVVAVIDVLGFTKRLEKVGLMEMHRLYNQLLSVALIPNLGDAPWRRMLAPIGNSLCVPSLSYLPLNYAYFSDTVLTWVPLEPNRVVLFFERLASVFCEALRLQIPLRGAVSIGQAIMHKPSGTYLGSPIVEAAHLERQQEWTGITCGSSFKSPPRPLPLPVTSFVKWKTPMKARRRISFLPFLPKNVESEALLSGLVVDWPRKWREMYDSSANVTLKAMLQQNRKYRKYYENAISFVEFSDANPEWFMNIH